MSGRGRGRGRGGAGGSGGPGGGPGRDAFNAAFGGLSKEEGRDILQSFMRPTKGSGMLYPPLDESLVAYLPGPSKFEDRVVPHMLALNRDLTDGPKDASDRRTGAPWRLAGERKVVTVQIESYSDRYASKPAAAGPSQLDQNLLHLDKSMFPPSLWEAYFESGDAGAGGRAGRARATRAKRPRGEDDDEDGDDEPEREKSGSPGGSDDENDDFDFEEDSDDHQDYDANYFDNGEGDDDEEPQDENEEGGAFNDD